MRLAHLALGVMGTYAAYRLAQRVRRRISFDGKVVVITGGSRGLGLTIARQLARENARLVLIARDEAELLRAEQQITALGAEAITIGVDISDRLQTELAIAWTLARMGTIDVLINDAGTIQVGPIEHMTYADFQQAMNVNFWGALHAIAAALPEMRDKKFGRIVNISSIGGQIALPHLTPYTASKFALVGLSESLHAELAKDNIFVSTVCPTLMRTGSPRNAEFKGRADEEYSWFSVADSLPGLSISAERAAARIITAVRYGLASTFVSPVGRAAAVLARLAPELIADLSSGINRLLPAPNALGDAVSRRGFELGARVDHSVLTKLSRDAAVKNNEV